MRSPCRNWRSKADDNRMSPRNGTASSPLSPVPRGEGWGEGPDEKCATSRDGSTDKCDAAVSAVLVAWERKGWETRHFSFWGSSTGGTPVTHFSVWTSKQ